MATSCRGRTQPGMEQNRRGNLTSDYDYHCESEKCSESCISCFVIDCFGGFISNSDSSMGKPRKEVIPHTHDFVNALSVLFCITSLSVSLSSSPPPLPWARPLWLP